MPNSYLSVLYKHIIQVEIKNVELKVGGGGTNIPLPPPPPPQSKKWGRHMPPFPRFLRQCHGFFYMHHPTDKITHTTAFVTPVMEHWLEREIAQWVHHEGSIR